MTPHLTPSQFVDLKKIHCYPQYHHGCEGLNAQWRAVDRSGVKLVGCGKSEDWVGLNGAHELGRAMETGRNEKWEMRMQC
jgi:hypothetical protein